MSVAFEPSFGGGLPPDGCAVHTPLARQMLARTSNGIRIVSLLGPPATTSDASTDQNRCRGSGFQAVFLANWAATRETSPTLLFSRSRTTIRREPRLKL